LETRVPYFIDLVVKNCMNEHDQQVIKTGLLHFNKKTEGKLNPFSKEEKLTEIKKTDEAAFKDDVEKAWFRIIKKPTLRGLQPRSIILSPPAIYNAYATT
jgi:Gluconate 2-dehydrogenase subunit 3